MAFSAPPPCGARGAPSDIGPASLVWFRQVVWFRLKFGLASSCLLGVVGLFFRSSNRLHIIIIINTSTRHHVARMRSIIQHAPSPVLHLASRSVTERPHIIISSTSYGSERLTPPLITDRTSHRTDSPVPSRRPTNHHTFVSTPSSRLRPPATQWRGLRPKLKLRFALRGLSGSSPPPSCPYHSPSPPA